MASELEKALAAQYAGNGPMFMPSTSVNDLYAGMLPAAQPRTNPLAPSQGGPWPASQPQRPRSTPLSPQNYNPTPPPHIPNDPRRATAEMKMLPFPPAYPGGSGGKLPIDITVNGGATQTAGIPMPQRRPWNAPTEMDLAAIAAQEAAMQQPVASAYAPQPAENPAVAAATGAGQPQTSWMQDMMTGLNGLLNGGAQKPQGPGASYDAANAAAAERARTQDRSGIGTDGYVRDAAGNVTGRDPKYAGMTPSQMYDHLSGRNTGARIDGNPDNSTFSGDSRHDSARRARARAAKAGGGPNPLSLGMGFVGGASGIARPVTAGPVQAPRTASFSTGGGIARPVTLGPVQAPMQPGTGGPMLAPSRSIGPVTGGIMAPAQVQRQRKAPIMRSA